MQHYFGENNFELHFMDTDTIMFSFEAINGLIKELKHFK